MVGNQVLALSLVKAKRSGLRMSKEFLERWGVAKYTLDKEGEKRLKKALEDFAQTVREDEERPRYFSGCNALRQKNVDCECRR
jgi:hypothetical protein